MNDDAYMRAALEEARAAIAHGDVPVGAVIVKDGRVIARAHNARERDGDPTAHAELLVLREAAAATGGWRLDGCVCYVTLEPDAMCAGALVLARVERLVYGAPDPKAGAAGSVFDIVRDPRLNHRLDVTSGMLEQDCSSLLREFFATHRT
ncbi:MAG: tRNA adenosine(34) deaminase TadA [Actinomycetota bacterium]